MLVLVAGLTLGPARAEPSSVRTSNGPTIGTQAATIGARRQLDRLKVGLPPSPARSVALAEDVLGALENPTLDGGEGTIEIARIVSRQEAEGLGVHAADAPAIGTFDSPAKAILALARLRDHEPDATERASIARLDALPEPLRGSIAQFVSAFIVFDETSALAFAPGTRRSAEGKRIGRVLLARDGLLRATAGLVAAAAITDTPVAGGSSCPSVNIPWVVAIDDAGCDTTYTTDYSLQIDLGGDDTYLNNAGGGSPWADTATPNIRASGALVDLGAGDDAYGDPAAPRGLGINGGAYYSSGFLFDDEGNDVYSAGSRGVNGGGYSGSGALLDGGGTDTYVAGLCPISSGSLAVNGGTAGATADVSGSGLLVDRSGNDIYRAGDFGVNGGSDRGSGHLIDGGGSDSYVAGITAECRIFPKKLAGLNAVNGGGVVHGSGFLFDAEGDDIYSAGEDGANGGSYEAAGFLLDLRGNDRYTASGAYGVNGAADGGPGGGTGLLADLGGSDHYEELTRAGVPISCDDCTKVPKTNIGVGIGAQIDQQQVIP